MPFCVFNKGPKTHGITTLMNSLKKLSDSELLSQTQNLVTRERELTLEILRHLQEIEKRRLYNQYACSSLFEYCTRILQYSEAAASRRINSMRMLKELPETATDVESGALNLSTLSTVQTFIRREEKAGKTYSKEQKQELLVSVKNQSKREVEKILIQRSPESAIPSEKQRVVAADRIEVKVVLTEAQLKKLEKIRGLLAHQIPDGALAEVLEKMMEITLDKVDPVRKEERTQARKEKTATPPAEMPTQENSKQVSAPLSRKVWVRDQGRCTHLDDQGKRCNSQFKLQVDHILPVALNGPSELSNLRLLCAAHNQWAAIQKLGKKTMELYLTRRR